MHFSLYLRDISMILHETLGLHIPVKMGQNYKAGFFLEQKYTGKSFHISGEFSVLPGDSCYYIYQTSELWNFSEIALFEIR